MAHVEVRELTKVFGQVHAVDGVDLAVGDGELVVLLGPSGCGKTTLMRMIAGLERPTSGDIYIGGRRVDADVPPRARGIAMVFQSYALYPHKTAFDNIAFPLEAQRVPRPAIRDRVGWAARKFGIAEMLQRRPRELSGGERQRVALGRALVRNPEVVLLDEPLSNLDAKLRASARDEVRRFQKEIGTTTLYVTHDQVEAMGLGDRIAVMNRGRVRQIGAPQEVYDHPADTFVATFVGSPPMNLVDLDARRQLGFRPESLLPVEVFAPARAVVTLGFRVRRVEYLGSDRLVYGSLEGGEVDGTPIRGGEVIAKLPVTVGVPVTEGTEREFAVAREDLRYFDRETGLSVSNGRH